MKIPSRDVLLAGAGILALPLMTWFALGLASSGGASQGVPTAVAPPQSPVTPGGVLAQQLFDGQNRERATAGAAPLKTDALLTRVAQQRADDMASEDYISHTSPSGESALTLLVAAKYGYAAVAENIARVDRGETSEGILGAFMKSPTHHDSILDARFTAVGIGFAVGRDDLNYVAVIFTGQ